MRKRINIKNSKELSNIFVDVSPLKGKRKKMIRGMR